MRLKGLLDFFGSLEIAWQAPIDALQAAGLSGKIIENLLNVRKGVDLERDVGSGSRRKASAC